MERTEHTGLPTGWRVDDARGGDHGAGTVVRGWVSQGDKRERESRVLPFARKVAGEIRVGDLRARPIPIVPMRLSMAAARGIAARKQIALLLVESDDRLVGVVDERPLATAGDDVGVAEVMKPLGVCLRPAMSVARARDVFLAARLPILPVMAGGIVIGAIARGEIDRALASDRVPTGDAAPTSLSA